MYRAGTFGSYNVQEAQLKVGGDLAEESDSYDEWDSELSEEDPDSTMDGAWSVQEESRPYETPVNHLAERSSRGPKPALFPKPKIPAERYSFISCPGSPPPSPPKAPLDASLVRQTAWFFEATPDEEVVNHSSNNLRRCHTTALPLRHVPKAEVPIPPSVTTLPRRTPSKSPNLLRKLGGAVQVGRQKLSDRISRSERPVVRVLPQKALSQNSFPEISFPQTEVSEIDGCSSVESSLEKYPWYHGPINREQAERRLGVKNVDGCFLIRRRSAPNNSDRPFALSLMYQGKFYHLHIRRKTNGKFSVGLTAKQNESELPSVAELVNFYRDRPLYLISRTGDELCCTTVLTVYPSSAEFASTSRVF